MDSWFTLAKSRVSVCFIDNGSSEPLAEQDFIRDWSKFHHIQVVRNEQNTGVYPTFQQGLGLTKSPFIFYSHNDVEMLEWGWDEKMNRIIKQAVSRGVNPGVLGMFGAYGIGTPDLYVKPYHFTQLMRRDCITVQGMHDGKSAALLETDAERIIVLDGFSLIVSRAMVCKAMRGAFDYKRFPAHHMYDIDICVTSHVAGFTNWCIDVDCKHHGGVTSTREKWAEEMGSSDQEIHRQAHRVFYDKWRGKLPLHIKLKSQ